MTLTRHAHYIAGTPTDDEYNIVPVNCGGPTVCDICDFDARWYKDYAEAKRKKQTEHRVFPGDVDTLDSQIMRKISAKMRANNPAPSFKMRIKDYNLAASIYALADAIDSVARDLELE